MLQESTSVVVYGKIPGALYSSRGHTWEVYSLLRAAMETVERAAYSIHLVDVQALPVWVNVFNDRDPKVSFSVHRL